MARVTLRLPDSLHRTIARRAEAEGVSMNQYLVYAITQVTSLEAAAEQRNTFDQIRSQFSDDQAENALKEMLEARAD